LYREEFYLAVSHDHPLSAKQQIDFKEIRQIPIVMFPQTHQCRKMIDVTCTSIGFDLQPIIETNTVDSIISLVQEGAGATILSGTLLALYNTNNQMKVIKIVNPTLCRRIGIVHHKDKYVGFAAKQFMDLLTNHVKMMKFEQPQTCDESTAKRNEKVNEFR
jgi:DNA-binding transcriptional LysR family regulator